MERIFPLAAAVFVTALFFSAPAGAAQNSRPVLLAQGENLEVLPAISTPSNYTQIDGGGVEDASSGTLSVMLSTGAAPTRPTRSGIRKAAKVKGDPTITLKSMYTADYLELKYRVLAQFKDAKPGRFGEYVKGVRKNFDTDQKVIALTFDACGGKHSGYNAELIEYLRREKIRATLFVTGLWIGRNKKTFLELAADPLFEIENHGLLHRACSVTGRTKFNVMPTRNMGDVIDEMELNARKIKELTGRRPLFFRSATAYMDELSAKIAGELGMEAVSFNVLSGDALPRTSARTMARNIMKGARCGAVVIMHFNIPERHELEALKEAVPLLRAKGYRFDKMKNIPVNKDGNVEITRYHTVASGL